MTSYIDLLKEHIVDSVLKARKSQSKCTSEILAIQGMSGKMTRHLYNNLCSLVKPDGSRTRYLEIGSWMGSSTVSALYKNPIDATIIDDWSEFGGPRDEFYANMNTFLRFPEVDTHNIQIIEADCFSPHIHPNHAPYDIYLFDGGHEVESHEKAITGLWKHLANTCIILIDDWNWAKVKYGTYYGLAKMNANVAFKMEISSPEGKDGFWNGCGIFVITKNSFEHC